MTDKKIYHRYRILAGFHKEGPKGEEVMVSALPQPDVFESPHNLLDFNSPGAQKFERVHPSTPLTKDVYKSNGELSEGQLSQEEIDKQRENLALKNQLDEKNSQIERLQKELEQTRLNSPAYTTEDDSLPEDNPFEGMNIEQLRSYARKNNINLKGKTSKRDIMEVLTVDLEVNEGEVDESFINHLLQGGDPDDYEEEDIEDGVESQVTA